MEAVKSGKHGERIVAAIRQRVYNWDYPPNHPLGEEELSREFGVSRSPVREALRSLEAEGLVRRIPNRGYFVRQYKSNEIEELYVVRLALELFVIEELARRPEARVRVGELARPWLDILDHPASRDPVELARVDETFHESLAALTANSMLLEHLRGINARLFVFRAMDFTRVLEQNSLKDSCDSHLAIIDAVTRGDVPASREAIRANLAMSLDNVDKAMGRILAKSFNV